MDPTCKITANPEIIAAEVGDEISLLSIKTGVYYTLNAMGATIWRLISQPRTLVEIKDYLLKEFAVDEMRCERDLLRWVEELRNQGLIEMTVTARG